MKITKHTASITTTTASTDSAYTPVANGIIRAIKYDGNISTTADLSITSETGGLNILTSLTIGTTTFQKYPVAVTVNTTNGSITNYAYVPVSEERIKVAVTNSSAASQTGTFNIFVEGA